MKTILSSKHALHAGNARSAATPKNRGAFIASPRNKIVSMGSLSDALNALNREYPLHKDHRFLSWVPVESQKRNILSTGSNKETPCLFDCLPFAGLEDSISNSTLPSPLCCLLRFCQDFKGLGGNQNT